MLIILLTTNVYADFRTRGDLFLGDGSTSTHRYIYYDNDGLTDKTLAQDNPNIRWNYLTNKWQISNDGTTWSDIVTVAGSGDMTKAVYDKNDNDIIDQDAGGTGLSIEASNDGYLFYSSGVGTLLNESYLIDTDDIIKDSNVDWGSGAGQVDTDDIPEGSTNLYYDLTIQDNDTSSIYDGLIFPDGTLTESGSTATYIPIDPDTVKALDNDGSMFYMNSDNDSWQSNQPIEIISSGSPFIDFDNETRIEYRNTGLIDSLFLATKLNGSNASGNIVICEYDDITDRSSHVSNTDNPKFVIFSNDESRSTQYLSLQQDDFISEINIGGTNLEFNSDNFTTLFFGLGTTASDELLSFYIDADMKQTTFSSEFDAGNQFIFTNAVWRKVDHGRDFDTDTRLYIYGGTDDPSGIGTNSYLLLEYDSADNDGKIYVGNGALELESENDSIEIPSDHAFYIGDRDTNGSWRFKVSGNDLYFERRESSVWIRKASINATP